MTSAFSDLLLRHFGKMSKKPGYTHFYQTMSALLANMVTITTASAAAPIDSTFLPLLTLEQISKCTYLSITTFFGKNTALQGYVSLWSDPLDRPPCYFGSYWASEKNMSGLSPNFFVVKERA